MGSTFFSLRALGGLDHPIKLNSAFVFEGDSISNAFGVTAPQAFPTLVYNDPIIAARSPAGYFNFASDGATIDIVAARYTASVYPKRPAALGTAATYLFLEIGINGNADDPATTWPKVETYINTAKADGFTLIYISPGLRTGVTTRAALVELAQKSITPNIYVDFSNLWHNRNDLQVFQDGLHPTVRGHAMLAQLVVDSILRQNRRSQPISPDGVGYLSDLIVDNENTNAIPYFKCRAGNAAGLGMQSDITVWIIQNDGTNNLKTLYSDGIAAYITTSTLSPAGHLSTLGCIKPLVKTLAQLNLIITAAAAGAGARATITDATQTLTAGIGAVIVGGGANVVPAYSDGATWRYGG